MTNPRLRLSRIYGKLGRCIDILTKIYLVLPLVLTYNDLRPAYQGRTLPKEHPAVTHAEQAAAVLLAGNEQTKAQGGRALARREFAFEGG